MNAEVDLRCWYAVTAKPGQDIKAEENLKERGYDVWLPSMIKIVHRSRQAQQVRLPLFPGYVFVARTDGQAFAPILSTPGVSGVVRSNRDGTPDTIGGAKLLAFRNWIEPDGQPLDMRNPVQGPWSVKPGDKVRIPRFAMADREFLCIATKEDRIKILLDFLGAKREIWVASDVVIRAG